MILGLKGIKHYKTKIQGIKNLFSLLKFYRITFLVSYNLKIIKSQISLFVVFAQTPPPTLSYTTQLSMIHSKSFIMIVVIPMYFYYSCVTLKSFAREQDLMARMIVQILECCKKYQIRKKYERYQDFMPLLGVIKPVNSGGFQKKLVGKHLQICWKLLSNHFKNQVVATNIHQRK